MTQMSGRFFDTNVILYLLDGGIKADQAEKLLQSGGMISVQVLNETLVNCRRKAGLNWDEARTFLAGIRSLVNVQVLTTEVHDIGVAVGSRYQLSFYDAMIVAAGLVSGCDELLSEDMHDGLVVEKTLTIRNPFNQRYKI